MIVRYECDKPMATKKGLLKLCTGRCSGCIAALAVEDNGLRHHVVRPQGEGTEMIRLRNAEALMKQGRILKFVDPKTRE